MSLISSGCQTSSLRTSSESPTPRSCALRWTPCSTSSDPSTLPLAHLGVTPISAVTTSTLAAVTATASPSPALLVRLTPQQRASFLRVWERLPAHLLTVSFDLQGLDRTPLAIEHLGDVFCDSADVFSKSKTEFSCCSLMPFKMVPQDSAPVKSRPHRINPIFPMEFDAALSQYVAADKIQQSTSPYSSPLVVIQSKSGGVRITVNYKKLNQISSVSQLPTPRVDQVLDSLGTERVPSLFDLVSSFHQITAY